MSELVRAAWRNRRRSALLAATLAAGLAGFYYAVTVDEGTKRHIRKQFGEVSRMPGRLLT